MKNTFKAYEQYLSQDEKANEIRANAFAKVQAANDELIQAKARYEMELRKMATGEKADTEKARKEVDEATAKLERIRYEADQISKYANEGVERLTSKDVIFAWNNEEVTKIRAEQFEPLKQLAEQARADYLLALKAMHDLKAKYAPTLGEIRELERRRPRQAGEPSYSLREIFTFAEVKLVTNSDLDRVSRGGIPDDLKEDN